MAWPLTSPAPGPLALSAPGPVPELGWAAGRPKQPVRARQPGNLRRGGSVDET